MQQRLCSKKLATTRFQHRPRLLDLVCATQQSHHSIMSSSLEPPRQLAHAGAHRTPNRLLPRESSGAQQASSSTFLTAQCLKVEPDMSCKPRHLRIVPLALDGVIHLQRNATPARYTSQRRHDAAQQATTRPLVWCNRKLQPVTVPFYHQRLLLALPRLHVYGRPERRHRSRCRHHAAPHRHGMVPDVQVLHALEPPALH